MFGGHYSQIRANLRMAVSKVSSAARNMGRSMFNNHFTSERQGLRVFSYTLWETSAPQKTGDYTT